MSHDPLLKKLIDQHLVVDESKQCWKCGDMDPAGHAKCDVPACGMREGKPAKKPLDDFDLRGLLAAKLHCWHRLTGAEADELIAFVGGLMAAQATLTDDEIDEIGVDFPGNYQVLRDFARAIIAAHIISSMITHITDKEMALVTTLRRTTEALTQATKERDALIAELASIKGQQPVLYMPYERPDEYRSNSFVNASRSKLAGWLPLFLAAGAQTIPAGYQLVPVEPTEVMCKAGDDCQDADPRMDDSPSYYAYKAMLAAAPVQAGAQDPISSGHPDDAGFELWWSEHMPEAVQSVAISAWNAAQPAPVQAQERKPLTMIEMVDAAMVETADIYPPITRSQCERIIRASERIDTKNTTECSRCGGGTGQAHPCTCALARAIEAKIKEQS